MRDDLPPIDFENPADRRTAIDRIDYFLVELRKLVDRGMVTPEALATLEQEKSAVRVEIERQGEISDAIALARARIKTNPREALALAEKARGLDRSRAAAWELSVAALGMIREFTAAIDVCRQADALGHAGFLEKIAGFEAETARADRAKTIESALARARLAALRGDHHAAFEACEEVIALAPTHVLALSMRVGSLVAMGRIDDAETARSALRIVAPVEAADWANRIRSARENLASKPIDDLEVIAGSKPGEPLIERVSFFGEFLEEHWQKLILGLAVLLIAVSSTVGASLVLGDRLWNAEGKCLLATVYTLMFAAFGRGLARWGADRAGRIMRLTTLVVLPLNFSLVGELPGLGRASAIGLSVLVIDCAAMIALAWIVCRALGLSGGKGTPLALIAMGLINALTARSASFSEGIAAMLAVSLIFFGSSVWLGSWLARHRDPPKETGADSPYFALGLLAFFAVCAVGRIGATVLRVPPTLYALPVMLASVSILIVAEGLEAAGHPPRWLALLRLSGYSFSALAFALGLAIPNNRELLFTGNTLLVAIVGLGLYFRALWRARNPAFLYAGFAALFLAYFATQTFLHDLIFAHVEGTLSHWLGYGRKLPFPFKALNGLVLNAVLAALSLFFSGRFQDRRLAWHCHLIGIPLSIAACVLSGFEPTAAIITLAAYTIAYAIAVRVFVEPRLLYLACAAYTGAMVAALTRFGSLTVANWSIILTCSGLLFWLVVRLLAWWKIAIEYRLPIARSSRVLAVFSLLLGVFSSLPPTWSGAAALAVLAVYYVLIGLEMPRVSVAFAAATTAAMALLISIRLGFNQVGMPLSLPWFAASVASLAVIYQILAAWLRVAEWRGETNSRRLALLRVYALPLYVLGMAIALFASTLAIGKINVSGWNLLSTDLFGLATAGALVSAALAIATIWTDRAEGLAHLSVFTAASASILTSLGLFSALGWPASTPILGFAIAASSLILVGLGDRVRDRETGWLALYRRPLASGMIVLVALGWVIGGLSWWDSRWLGSTLLVTAFSLAIAIRQRPVRALPELALSTALASWLAFWGTLGLRDWEALPRAGLLILIYVIFGVVATECLRRFRSEPKNGSARHALARAFPEFALVAATVGLGFGFSGFQTGNYGEMTGIFAIGAVLFLWFPRDRREVGLSHVGLLLAWLALGCGVRSGLGDGRATMLLGWLALASSLQGMVLCGLRIPRRGWIDTALRDVGIGATISGCFLALAAAMLSLDAYPMAVAALLIAIPTFAFSAAIDGASSRVFGANISAASAAYLTLFELGRGREGNPSTLGVLASLLAIVFWLITRLVSRDSREDRRQLFEKPLEITTIVLAVLAIPFEWNAIGPILIASLPFWLLLRSRPWPGWLYPAVGLLVAATGFAVHRRFGFDSLILWGILAAFACWLVGFGINRRAVWSRRFELPLFHLSIAMGFLAIFLRIDASSRLGAAWSAQAWVPAALAILSILMIKPFAQRFWVDGFVFFLSLAIVSSFASGLDSLMVWLVAILAIALLWRLAERGSAGSEAALGDRFGLQFHELSRVFASWSLAFLALAAVPLFLRVSATLLPISEFSPPIAVREWTSGVLAVLLIAANVELSARDRGEWRGLGLHLSALLMAWWIAVPSSPVLLRTGLEASAVVPVATAILALVAVVLGTRSTERIVAFYGLGLAILAVFLTAGRAGLATTATVFLATAASARLALRDRRSEIVGIAAALWGLSFLSGSRWAAASFGWSDPATIATTLAIGQVLAAIGLVAAGRWIRAFGIRIEIMDMFAGISLIAASLGVLGTDFGVRSSTLALLNVGVMFAVGSLCVVLAIRWSSMALGFAAQGSILVGYLAFRGGFAMSPSGDATSILILAGIDLGIAEIAGQSRRRLFAIPSLATGLALPLIAVALAFRDGRLGETPMFTLFAAGTFYATTCGRLQKKVLGYAAAVLYNAALWVLWGHFGWQFAENPQFYLVPVGFSTILFAEANRGELGRAQVNGIRGFGLSLIYLTLAMPIYQTASLAAWALVLGLSLLAVFVGIGLRSQTFLWMGLAAFLLDVVYQLGRIGMEHALAKWAIMLVVGLGLVLFVALNEKKRLLATIRGAVDVVLKWE